MSDNVENNGLPSLLIKAAQSAAVADGLLPENKVAVTSSDDASNKDNDKPRTDAPKTLTSTGATTTFSNNSKDDPSILSMLASASASASANVLTSNGAAIDTASALNSVHTAAGATTMNNAGALSAGAASAILAQQKAAMANSAGTKRMDPVSAGTAAAASATGVGVAQLQLPKSSKKGPALRRGKWTSEEEAYANRLIQEFKSGLLPLTDGTTLRTFLSKLLNCDPMRISKKFVGSNCIGKQVFRRRTADINRLTSEQIQQSRNELSELERRFLERVAQTNRVKSGGGSSGGGHSSAPSPSGVASRGVKSEDAVTAMHGGPISSDGLSYNPNGAVHIPPWMCAPTGYNPTGNRAAAAGRALLQQHSGSNKSMNTTATHNMPYRSYDPTSDPLNQQNSSRSLLTMAEMQQRVQHQQQQQQNTMYGNGQSHQQQNTGFSGTALSQIARNASAARMATHNPLANSDPSSGIINNLSLYNSMGQLNRTGTSAHNNLASHNSLVSIMDRQSSFDALMSLDIQSLKSIDNLANLIQSGTSASTGNVSRDGMKNWSTDNVRNQVPGQIQPPYTSLKSNNASALELQQLIRTLSHGKNLRNYQDGGSTSHPNGINSGNNSFASNASFAMNPVASSVGGTHNPLQSTHNINRNAVAANYSQMSLNSLLRNDSSTGLTALRMQDGLLNQRNSSVDDFLSLVANGDIPHQDPHMLNVPLHSILQQQAARQQMLAAANANNNFGGHHSSRNVNGAPLSGNPSNSGSYLSALTATTGGNSKRKSMESSSSDMDLPMNKQYKTTDI